MRIDPTQGRCLAISHLVVEDGGARPVGHAHPCVSVGLLVVHVEALHVSISSRTVIFVETASSCQKVAGESYSAA